MKKWAGRMVLLAVLAALGFWLARWLFPSPEQVIRQRLTELARTASFNSNQGALTKLADAQALTTFFATNAEVTVDVPGQSRRTFSGRDELLEAATGARAVVSGLTVRFFDITVTVAPDKESAEAILTATGEVPGEKNRIVQVLKFVFKKLGREWMILRVETVKSLS
jgi:hypothetical protein